MKVFELYLDSFKYPYCGLWSSLEKAVTQLPENKRFLMALDYSRPYYSTGDKEVSAEADWEYNKNVKPSLSIHEDDGYITLKVTFVGYKFNLYKTVETSEVKVEGQPYVPAKSERVKVGEYFLTSDDFVKTVDVTVLNVDDMSNDDCY